MEKKIAIITGLIILCLVCDAQYSTYKAKYDYHTYSYQMGDPYKPSQMSFASALIPGLGQLIEGETVRGLAFFGGSIALVVYKWETYPNPTAQSFYLNLIEQIGLRVWSGINANRIAKVYDLAFRDKYKSTENLKILPYQGLLDNYGLCKIEPVGITLLISF